MIYILLIGLIVQLIYCYYVFGRDLFSPSAIICEVFILSVLACLYNISGSSYDIQPTTMGVILGGNTVFILVSTIIHLFFKKSHKSEVKEPEKLHYIHIKQFNIIIITAVYLLFSVLFIILSMSAIKNLGSGNDFTSAMGAYRSTTADEGSSLPSWLTKMGVVLNIGAYVLTYIFINNFLVDKKKKNNYLLLLCVLFYLVSSVFTAQRTTILLMFIYALFITYSLLNRKYYLTKKINHKYIIRGVIIVIAFLFLFGLTRGLFGRQSKATVVDNVTAYTGNSIEFLDAYIKNPSKSQQFGEELFYQFRSTLSGLGLAEKPIGSLFLEFRRATAGNYGNIYTGYREYIHDFGYWSIIIYQSLMALFFGVWYEKVYHRKLRKGIDLSFIIFAWFVSCVLFRFSIMNAFFTTLAYFIFTHWYVFLFWKIFLSLKIVSKNTAHNCLERHSMSDYENDYRGDVVCSKCNEALHEEVRK